MVEIGDGAGSKGGCGVSNTVLIEKDNFSILSKET